MKYKNLQCKCTCMKIIYIIIICTGLGFFKLQVNANLKSNTRHIWQPKAFSHLTHSTGLAHKVIQPGVDHKLKLRNYASLTTRSSLSNCMSLYNI